MKIKKVCCFTGHRPKKLPFGFNEADERCILLKQKIKEKVEYLITEQGVTHLFCL